MFSSEEESEEDDLDMPTSARDTVAPKQQRVRKATGKCSLTPCCGPKWCPQLVRRWSISTPTAAVNLIFLWLFNVNFTVVKAPSQGLAQ